MRAFSIIDASVRADRRRPCATLYYDEERREYRIEIEPWATEDDVPMLLIPFVHKRERVLDGTWSRKWVEERIVPPSRQNIGQVLKANGLTEYDDFRLLLVGMGRCSQDDFELVEIDPERKGAGLSEGGDAPTLAQRMGAELERARHDAGFTQLELARRSGIQQAAISKVERGLGNPTLALIETLAHGLGVKLDITVSKDMEAG